MSVKQVHKILSEREQVRLEYTLPTHYPTPQHSFYSVARSLKHRASNRYSNILAYDRTAVFSPLDTANGPNGSGSYINANVISDGKSWWVAAQAPTPSTFQQFFQAIYDRTASRHPLISPLIGQQSRDGRTILVQLTGWEEKGIIKADRYLLPSTYGELSVKVTARETREDIQSSLTTLTINGMEVLHYHFEAWPDHGVPDGQGVEALRRLILEIDQRRQGEVWVHCSAGVGRTGTFIALSSLLTNHPQRQPVPESPLGPLPNALKNDRVAQTVDQIREWRGMLVQGPDQLQLIYQMTQSEKS